MWTWTCPQCAAECPSEQAHLHSCAAGSSSRNPASYEGGHSAGGGSARTLVLNGNGERVAVISRTGSSLPSETDRLVGPETLAALASALKPRTEEATARPQESTAKRTSGPDLREAGGIRAIVESFKSLSPHALLSEGHVIDVEHSHVPPVEEATAPSGQNIDPQGSVVFVPQGQQHGAFPPWLISLVVAQVVILGLMFLWNLFRHSDHGRSEASIQSALKSPGVGSLPLAQSVEIAGLRVIIDGNHKAHLRYLVVNHSASTLEHLALKISVSSLAQGGSGVLLHLSSNVDQLGGYQSKDVDADLDSSVGSQGVPDWAYLRADVEVTAQ